MIRRLASASAGACILTFIAAGCSGGGGGSGSKTDLGLRVSPLSGPTTEAGGTSTFTVVLRTKPKSDVILPLSSSDALEGAVTPAQLVFTKENWEAPQTVTITGVDDEFVDGHSSYEVIFGATQSDDSNYAGLQAASIPAVNLDDEELGVVVSAVSGPTTEAGGEAQFTIALAAKPQSVVGVAYSSSDEGEGEVAGQSLEFTPENWNVPKTINVVGVDDGSPDGSQTFAVVFQPFVSVDLAWDGFEMPAVLIVNVDDDAPGITVSAPSGSTTEAGGTATFTVVLNSQPAQNVILSLASDDDTEAETSTDSLVFTPSDYSVVRTVTVTGLDDDAADGTTAYQVVFEPAASLDMAYDGLEPGNVDLFNQDDEVPAIGIDPLNGLTSESGDSAQFDVVLAARPANDVTLLVSVSTTKEAVVSPSQITFTDMNWDVPVQVTVTGRNDFLDDGHKPYQLVLTPTGDPTYAAIGASMAQLTNVNDGPPAKVLVFDDGFGTHADDVATLLNLDVRSVNSQGDFLSEYLTQRPDVIVWEASSGAALDPSIEPTLAAFLTSGGRLIYSDTDLDGQAGVQALLNVSAANPYEGFRTLAPTETLRGNLFNRGQLIPGMLLTGVNVVQPGTNGNEIAILSTAGNAVIAGTVVSTTTGLIAITTDHSVIVNGFAPDDAVGTNNDADSLTDMAELYHNELQYILDLPALQWRGNSNVVTAIPSSTSSSTGVGFVNIPIVVPHDYPITKASVSWFITNPRPADVDVFLVAPDGTRMELVTDKGSTTVANLGAACTPDSSRMTIADDAGVVVPTATALAPYPGSWKPDIANVLATVNGDSSAGTWTLQVADDTVTGTNGAVQCWSIMFSLEEE